MMSRLTSKQVDILRSIAEGPRTSTGMIDWVFELSKALTNTVPDEISSHRHDLQSAGGVFNVHRKPSYSVKGNPYTGIQLAHPDIAGYSWNEQLAAGTHEVGHFRDFSRRMQAMRGLDVDTKFDAWKAHSKRSRELRAELKNMQVLGKLGIAPGVQWAKRAQRAAMVHPQYKVMGLVHRRYGLLPALVMMALGGLLAGNDDGQT